jgi:hypothetical protein
MTILSLCLALFVFAALSPDDGMPSADAEELVRHVVVFKYTEDASDAEIQEITEAFRALQDKIPGIVSFEHGVNNSPEDLNQGFTHVYVITFEDEAARDAYLPHPEHQQFVDMLMGSGIFDEAFVVDYVPQP